MRLSLVLVALFVSSAVGDSKPASPAPPALATVESITLELVASSAAPRCQRLAYSMRVNVSTWAWVRSRVTCSDDKGAAAPRTTREAGVVPEGLRATIAKQYAALDARVPRVCKDAFPALTAEIVGKDGARVVLVDAGCEHPAYLRDLAATLASLSGP